MSTKHEVAAPEESNAPFWHRSDGTPSMGCLRCHDYKVCGGLQIEHSAFDCTQFCKCPNPETCDIPCIRNPSLLSRRICEIRGFDLDNIARAKPVPMPSLPASIPMIYGKGRRLDRLQAPAVAVCLRDLFSERTGKPKFSNKEALAEHFRFTADAQLVIVGVSKDRPLERYWSLARKSGFPGCLKTLSPALVTTPNFSLFTTVPRWDNLHSLKRIAICWQEMTAAGLPASLHINARTDRDYERLMDFIAAREEVQSITFEFGTGAGIPQRSDWHIAHLCKMGEHAGRRLQLLLKGGHRFINTLDPYFRQVVLLDSVPFMKSVRRKMLSVVKGKAVWEHAITLRGQSIDALLQHNVDERSKIKT